MTAFPHHRFTLEQYVQVASDARDCKLEYFGGAILAMAGGSPRHNHVSVMTSTAMVNALRGRPCRVYSSDQRIATPDGLYTYPDISVVCGKAVPADAPDTFANPALLVEVLSPSTREYDTEKLVRYKKIVSLKDVLLIEPDASVVVHHSRAGEGWVEKRYEGLAAVVPLAIGVELRMGDVYEGVFDA